MKKISIILFLLIFFSGVTYAHQGRTDSYGGHYDRSTGTYHYHSGQYAGTGEYTKPVERGGLKINYENDEDSLSGLEVILDSEPTEIDNLNTEIKTLKQDIQEKQNTIEKLMSEVNEKKDKIEQLEDKSGEYVTFGFILIIAIFISYNIGKDK